MARLLLLASSSKSRRLTIANMAQGINQMQDATIQTSNTNDSSNGRIEVRDGEASRLQSRLALELIVTDPEVCAELASREAGNERECYALAALRIGVQAMRQANGAIDAASVREEGTHLVQSIREVLVDHASRCTGDIAGSLKSYFDPESGQLVQRLDRLVKKDGEIDDLLRQHLGNDSSTVAQTLASHIGEQSPLLKMLSPDQANGLLASLRDVIQLALRTQREQIVGHFSLDDKSSALSRLLTAVTDANGQLRKDLAEDVGEVRNEFSLDNEEGALARLVKRVESAQETISDQFSQDNEDSAMSRMARLLETVNGTVKGSLTLDDEDSPLSLLRRQLLEVIGQIEKSNHAFQTELRETVATLKARKKEKARSTRRGDDFQEAVGLFLDHDSRSRGDICKDTTNSVGRLPRRKTGDFVLTMGPESIARGGRITIEAKEEQGYDVPKALAELEEARNNRDASIGLFVLSQQVAPEDMEPLSRYGNDIVIVWDAEDPLTDVIRHSALSLARGLATRLSVESQEMAAELTELDDAMQRIAKDASGLSEIIKWSTTVEGHGNKIRTKAERLQQDLVNQVERLDEHLGRLRTEPAMSA